MKPLGTIQILAVPFLDPGGQVDLVHLGETLFQPVRRVCVYGLLEKSPHKRVEGQVVLRCVRAPFSDDLFIQGERDVLHGGLHYT